MTHTGYQGCIAKLLTTELKAEFWSSRPSESCRASPAHSSICYRTPNLGQANFELTSLKSKMDLLNMHLQF